MACQIKKDKNGNVIGALAPNGKDSILFNKLAETTGNINIAYDLYAKFRTDEFKKWFGIDWENSDATDNMFTDNNGEPRFFSHRGKSFLLNTKGERRIVPEVKISNTSGLTFEEETATVDTAITLINDVRKENPKYFDSSTEQGRKNTKEFFSPIKDSKGNITGKGILADKILLNAFDGIPENTPDVAVNAYKVYKEQGWKAMLDSLPKGVTIAKTAEGKISPRAGLIMVYDQWEDVLEPKTKNILREGWRSRISNRLEDYGMRLRDDLEVLEEHDDDLIKIYERSNLEESPKDKLSNVTKSILGDVRSNSPNMFGFRTALPLDYVFDTIAENTVNTRSWQEMIAKLQNVSLYKPEILPIIQRLNNLNAQEQASVFSNFRMSYKNFLLFRADKQTQVVGGEVLEGVITRMFNSNQSNVSKKSITLWRNNSREYQVPNERALYQVAYDENGSEILTVSDKKKKALESAWSKVEKSKKLPGTAAGQEVIEVPEESIQGLGEFLWELGIQYGPTLESTIDNLKRYFEIGRDRINTTTGDRFKGIDLFKQFVYSSDNPSSGKNFVHIITNIRQDNQVDVFRDKSKIINKIAEISSLFDSRPFGSIVSVTNKQYYPINEPTALDEFIEEIKSDTSAEVLSNYLQDPFFSPGNNIKHQNYLLSALVNGTEEAKNALELHVYDGFKGKDEIVATTDYENQNEKVSLIVRLNAFANNNDTKGRSKFTKIAVTTQADRKRLDFLTIPRIEKLKSLGIDLTVDEIIEGVILQDLAKLSQAHSDVERAAPNEDKIKSLEEEIQVLEESLKKPPVPFIAAEEQQSAESKLLDDLRRQLEEEQKGTPGDLIEGYHYLPGTNPFSKSGPVFNTFQVFNFEDSEFQAGVSMSTFIDSYLTGDPAMVESKRGIAFKNLLNEKIEEFKNQLVTYETELKNRLKELDINLKQDVHAPSSVKKDFLARFILNDVLGRMAINQMIRGGRSFSKSTPDFYKRMGLLNTPGRKLMIRGESSSDPNYGMLPKYNEITITDFDFSDPETANRTADIMRDNLIVSGVSIEKANEIADKYRSVNKTDAQGLISLEMHRAIMMGIGQWDMVLDEQAYKNAKDPNNGRFEDNEGRPRPIFPTKPYHEEVTLRNNIMSPHMNKNSYMVVTPELAQLMPEMQPILDKMNEGVHVVNTRSATKGARLGVQDLQQGGTLEETTIVKMEGDKLRLPQILPKKKQRKIIFNRQVRKNIVANLNLRGTYNVNGVNLTGQEVYDKYHDLIAQNIKEDTKQLEQDLGITNLENAIKEHGTRSEEHAEAKLQYLKKIREEILKQVQDKQLPKNYVEALHIVRDGFNYNFEVPLAFPNYQAKFEQMFFSMYNNALFKQQIKGLEAVQIAEIGGAIVSGELQVYDGSSPAQIRIKASALGFPPGTNIEDVSRELLTVVMYRIPNQGKNMSVVAEVVDFLPESYEKAVMVPGGGTVQMGYDFDIDKMYIVMPETEKVDLTDEEKSEENSRISEEWNNFIGTPQWSPKAQADIIRKDIPNFNETKSKIEFANANNYIYNEDNNMFFDPKKSKKTITIKGDINEDVSKLTRKERDNAIFDIMKSVLTSPYHLEEVVTPLDDPRLENLAQKTHDVEKNQIDYNNPLSELKVEQINKLGKRQIGGWANQLSGRNVAHIGFLTISEDFAPIITYQGGAVEEIFSSIAVEKEFNPTTLTYTGSLTNQNISLWLSAAVDAANKPIQLDINDNEFTLPVAGLMLSSGVPVEDIIHFLNQPVIKEVIEHARNKGNNPSKIKKSLNAIARKYKTKIMADAVVKTMSSEELETLSNTQQGGNESSYLNNFWRFFQAGRNLVTINKIITPDTLSNINEISSVVSFLDTENYYLSDKGGKIIEGAEELIIAQRDNNDRVLSPISASYRNILNTMLKGAEQVGFINNRPSFYMFKEQLKEELGAFTFNQAQHKFIDKSLFLFIMSRPNSPIRNYFSKDMINRLYLDSKDNIATKLENAKTKYPKLIRDNIFVSNLQPNPLNDDKDQNIFQIQLDTSFETSVHIKNSMSNALLELLKNPKRFANDPNNEEEVKEIKNLGRILVANQLLTKGFAPGPGTYIDIIPTEVFTTNILFDSPSALSPIEYFIQEADNTLQRDYFSEDQLEFIRNFGAAKPGGFPLLKFVPYKRVKTNREGEVSFKSKDSLVYNDTLGYVGYFVTYPPNKDPQIFIRDRADNSGAVYKRLQLKGKIGKIIEIGKTGTEESVVNTEGSIQNLGSNIIKGIDSVEKELPNSVEQPLKICRR